MANSTQDAMLDKVHNMEFYVGLDSEYMNESRWEQMYHGVNLEPFEFYQSLLKLNANNKRFLDPLIKASWMDDYHPGQYMAKVLLKRNAVCKISSTRIFCWF